MTSLSVSVVISSYNGEKYIIEQLDSIRKQTQRVDEVIIADDCSTDNTVSLVNNFIEKYDLSNWKIIVNNENKGWRRNFMEAMWSSNGDLVFPCDQDDIWRNDKVERMSDIMIKNPKISVLTSNYCEFFENGKTRIGPWKNDKEVSPVKLNLNYMLVKSPGCTYCVRRQLLELSKKYWEPEYPHDALLWRLGLFSDGLYKYTDTLIKWRNHKSSAFAKESRNLKSTSAKKRWIYTAKHFNSTLQEYIYNDVDGNNENKSKVLNRTARWLKMRNKFYEGKNPFIGLYLMRYWSSYPRKRQYLGDWYLIYLKK